MNKALHGLLSALDGITRRLQEQLEYVLVLRENHAAAKATMDQFCVLEEYAKEHPLKQWGSGTLKEMPENIEPSEEISKDRSV